MSHTAWAAFSKVAQSGDLPKISRRQDVRIARDLEALQDTPYGKLIQTVELKKPDSSTLAIDVAHPICYLYAASKCNHFSNLLKTTFQRHPCSAEAPWSLCLYSDQAKPGNKMRQQNKRSSENIYITFLEFGTAALAKEANWLCVAAAQAFEISKIESGMAQLTAAILDMCFSKTSHNMRLAGVGIDLEDGTSFRQVNKSNPTNSYGVCCIACALAHVSHVRGHVFAFDFTRHQITFSHTQNLTV